MLLVTLVAIATMLLGLFLYTYRWNIFHPNHSHIIHVDGYERSFIYHIPKNLKRDTKLIIAYHGSGLPPFLMQIFTGHEFDLLADESGDAIIVYPKGYGGNWNDCRIKAPFPAKELNIDDVKFTEQLIDYFKRKYHVQKVYGVGFSNGGTMIFRLAAERPALFTAFATIGANLPTNDNNLIPAVKTPVSMMLIFGRKDPMVPFDGGRIVLDGQDWGTVESAEDTVAFWKKVNQAELETTKKTGLVNREDYYSHVTHKKLIFIGINDGGHTIPNRHFRIPIRKLGPMSGDVDAPVEIWEFFRGASVTLPSTGPD